MSVRVRDRFRSDAASAIPGGDVADALRIEGLSVRLTRGDAQRPILDGVDLVVHAGETVGLVGESGSGKSVTSRAALGMFPAGAEVRGRVIVGGVDVVGARRSALARVRGGEAAMIFQDPRAGINPVRRVGDFLGERMRRRGIGRAERRTRCRALLDSVGISDPDTTLRLYPHQMSGGMLQRVMIAAALSAEPGLLLADEPTTALDVTIQAEIIGLLMERRAHSGAAMLFVTHDLELAAAVCDRIYVMYAGRIVECRPSGSLFADPRHPYSVALLRATPRLESEVPVVPVPGRPLSLAEAPVGCAFAPRCPHAVDECLEAPPALVGVGDGAAACIRCNDEDPRR
ncbi:MAG TPA: ABC transporter ATP-binding protein [Solirubrobacteraceae bacterium]|nr:ABC transporter ATP-binding protein [Solirubrobacteraceae bacterium]